MPETKHHIDQLSCFQLISPSLMAECVTNFAPFLGITFSQLAEFEHVYGCFQLVRMVNTLANSPDVASSQIIFI